jgi:tetratricopeptide (TPR) repeat protein
VQMKVAETYYQQENFAKARTEFELLAQDYPASPFADSALYFAGLCASALGSAEGIDAAIGLWDELAQRGGPLAFMAQVQQALATRRKGDHLTALKLSDTLLASKDILPDQRRSLVYEKAELLATMGQQIPARRVEAVQLLQAFLKDTELPFLWRCRASVLLATILREQRHRDEALEICTDVVAIGTQITSPPNNPAEYLWFYQAGFMAIELLEESKQWEAAARMAERISRTAGNRAKEAEKRANELRLKHYLWDETQ